MKKIASFLLIVSAALLALLAAVPATKANYDAIKRQSVVSLMRVNIKTQKHYDADVASSANGQRGNYGPSALDVYEKKQKNKKNKKLTLKDFLFKQREGYFVRCFGEDPWLFGSVINEMRRAGINLPVPLDLEDTHDAEAANAVAKWAYRNPEEYAVAANKVADILSKGKVAVDTLTADDYKSSMYQLPGPDGWPVIYSANSTLRGGTILRFSFPSGVMEFRLDCGFQPLHQEEIETGNVMPDNPKPKPKPKPDPKPGLDPKGESQLDHKNPDFGERFPNQENDTLISEDKGFGTRPNVVDPKPDPKPKPKPDPKPVEPAPKPEYHPQVDEKPHYDDRNEVEPNLGGGVAEDAIDAPE